MIRRALVLTFALPLLAAPLSAVAATPVVSAKTTVESAAPVVKTDVSAKKKPHKAKKPKKKPTTAS